MILFLLWPCYRIFFFISEIRRRVSVLDDEYDDDDDDDNDVKGLKLEKSSCLWLLEILKLDEFSVEWGRQAALPRLQSHSYFWIFVSQPCYEVPCSFSRNSKTFVIEELHKSQNLTNCLFHKFAIPAFSCPDIKVLLKIFKFRLSCLPHVRCNFFITNDFIFYVDHFLSKFLVFLQIEEILWNRLRKPNQPKLILICWTETQR